MNSILRLALAVNRVLPANPQLCYESIATTPGFPGGIPPADIILFPQLAFSSPAAATCSPTKPCWKAAWNSWTICASPPGFGSLPSSWAFPWDNGQVVAACAVLLPGKLLGYVADSAHLSTAESELFLPPDTLFQCGDLRFSILPCNPLELPSRRFPLPKTDARLDPLPSYELVTAGSIAGQRKGYGSSPRTLGCAVAVSQRRGRRHLLPWLYRGMPLAYECGEKLGGFVKPIRERAMPMRPGRRRHPHPEGLCPQQKAGLHSRP